MHIQARPFLLTDCANGTLGSISSRAAGRKKTAQVETCTVLDYFASGF
jgi:hypothetical protein